MLITMYNNINNLADYV